MFSEKDYKLFEQICQCNERSLAKVLSKYLNSKYKNVIHTQDYVYAEGTLPVLLVAHMDTVFPVPPSNIYFDREKGVIWSPDGGIGDDRAGVFGILKIIQAGYRPSVVFTSKEETGGFGAQAFATSIKNPGVKYIIELDRHGEKDCVFYEDDNEEFVTYIEQFGFKEAWGTYSDICEIAPVWNVSAVNLSTGYMNEHCRHEYLKVFTLMSTVTRVKQMLDVIDAIEKPFAYIESDYARFYNNYKLACHKCKKAYSYYELIPTKMLDGTVRNLCPDCIVSGISWCHKCGSPYEQDDKDKKFLVQMCPDCRKGIYNAV